MAGFCCFSATNYILVQTNWTMNYYKTKIQCMQPHIEKNCQTLVCGMQSQNLYPAGILELVDHVLSRKPY
jgi:hypothetical protein